MSLGHRQWAQVQTKVFPQSVLAAAEPRREVARPKQGGTLQSPATSGSAAPSAILRSDVAQPSSGLTCGGYIRSSLGAAVASRALRCVALRHMPPAVQVWVQLAALAALAAFFSRCFAPRGRVDGAADASAQVGTSRGLGWEEPSSHERASAQRGAQLLGSWALSFREFPTIVFLRKTDQNDPFFQAMTSIAAHGEGDRSGISPSAGIGSFKTLLFQIPPRFLHFQIPS